MKLIIKRLFTILFVVIIITCLASCKTESEKELDLFKENYYKHYPDGYDKDFEWYEFTEKKISNNYRTGEKTVSTLSFVGYVDFERNDFKGITTKCSYIIEIVKFKDNKIVESSVLTCNFKDKKLRLKSEQIPKNDVSEDTVGGNNVKIVYLEMGFDILLFYPRAIDRTQVQIFSINVNDNCYIIDITGKSFSKDDLHSTKNGFIYDENYDIKEFFYYYNMIESDQLGVCYAQSITRTLKKSNEIKIEIENDYDIDIEGDDYILNFYLP